MTKTYSLEAYDNWFNCLSMLVATEVCRVSTALHTGRVTPPPAPVLPGRLGCSCPSDAETWKAEIRSLHCQGLGGAAPHPHATVTPSVMTEPHMACALCPAHSELTQGRPVSLPGHSCFLPLQPASIPSRV